MKNNDKELNVLKIDWLPDSLKEIKHLFDKKVDVFFAKNGKLHKAKPFPLVDSDIAEIESAFGTDKLSSIRLKLAQYFSPERIDKLSYEDMLRHAIAVNETNTGPGNARTEKPENLISLAVAIKNFAVSRATLKRAIANGTLKTYKKGGQGLHFVEAKAVAAIYPKR